MSRAEAVKRIHKHSETLPLQVDEKKKRRQGVDPRLLCGGSGLEGLELDPTAAQVKDSLGVLEEPERRSGPLSPSAIAPREPGIRRDGPAHAELGRLGG